MIFVRFLKIVVVLYWLTLYICPEFSLFTPHNMTPSSQPLALITGASSGIGLELARLFAKDGYALVLVARSLERLEALASTLAPAPVTCIQADLGLPGAAESLWQQLAAAGLHQPHVLVNNAGFGDFGPFADTPLETYTRMIALNIEALTVLTHKVLPAMRARKQGRILQLASTAAFTPGPLMGVYSATKAYVLHFSEALSMELQGTGVTVTTLCPGPTASGFQDAARMHESRLVKGKRMPTAAQVAAFGYKALHKGRVVVVHGWLNRFMVASVRFVPRSISRRIAYQVIRASH
jgi:short-subunit dehydrogenase